MESMNDPHAAAGFVTFDVLRLDGSETSGAVVDALASDVRARTARVAGFISSRIHVSLDGGTVAIRVEWVSEADCVPGSHSVAGVASATAFEGIPAALIEGPSAEEPAGVVSIATRHVGSQKSAHALARHLVETADWKRDFPGFVSATAYISMDGATYVNYPQWVSEDAQRAYMADPRNAAAQGGIARLEVAPPEFVMCTVAAHIERLVDNTR